MSEMTSTEMTSLNIKNRRPARFVFLLITFFALLFVFTLFKLPQNKITQLIQGYVQSALDPMGIYLSDRGRELSILKGFQYRLDHPSLELPDGTRIELDELTVQPSLLSLLTGKPGATLEVIQGASTIVIDAKGKADQFQANIKIQDADLGKLGVLAYAGNLKGSGLISGTVDLAGAPQDIVSWAGGVQLDLKKVRIDEQTLMGFSLPSIQVSEGKIDVKIENGKAVVKTVTLGKGADDIILGLTGDIALNRAITYSTLNLRVAFSFSDRVKQNISLLESIISPGKGADGKYAFKLNGSLGSAFPIPDPKN